MDKTPETLTIGIPIYDLVDPLDVAGPYEVFSNVFIDDKPALNVIVLAEKAGKDISVPTRFGLRLVPQAAFDDVDHLDVLWVPGGDPKALNRLMKGGAYLDALKRWSRNARLVTSVCEGAMLLAAAGLLDGYHATTHWAFIRCFQRWPSISPVPLNPDDPECVWPRFVVDRNRVTGGGISSGLDEALQVVLMLFDQQVAESVQVTIQYFPESPVHGTIPVPPSCPLDSAGT